MRAYKLGFLLFLMLALTIIVAILPWIPSWSFFPWLVGGAAIVYALYLSYQLLRRLSRRLQHSQVSSLQGSFTLVACGVALLGVLAMTGLFSSFMANGGLFPPQLLRTYDFPDAGVTLYYYDNTFLKPQVALYEQRSFLPFMQQVSIKTGHHDPAPDPIRQGKKVTLEPFVYDLETGQTTP